MLRANDVGVATLDATGTAEEPSVFTSAEENPAGGDWSGLWCSGIPSGDNRLEHVRLEHTGSDCGCSMVTCNADVRGVRGRDHPRGRATAAFPEDDPMPTCMDQ